MHKITTTSIFTPCKLYPETIGSKFNHFTSSHSIIIFFLNLTLNVSCTFINRIATSETIPSSFTEL